MAKSNLTKKAPEKKLLQWISKSGGRNNSGKITVRHRGGGYKKLYRKVDFGQTHKDIPGTVIAIEYDPNRTAYLALIEYGEGDRAYILAPDGLSVGDTVVCKDQAELRVGNRMKVRYIPSGTMVHNIALMPDRGGVIVRGAGTAAKILGQEGKYTHVELPSTEARKILSECFATIGAVSNPEHRYKKIANAGRKRKMGWRPSVRGVAMNPVDHPHGGGEGRSPVGMKHPKTPWGKTALGVKTRRNKKWTGKFIVRRRKRKKKK